MGKLILYMFTTVDGFIAGPNGEFDDYEPADEEMRFANELFGAADGIVFGRKTYEGFVDYWDSLDVAAESTRQLDREFSALFRKTKRVAVSRTKDSLADGDRVIRGDIGGQLSRLKQESTGYLLLICGPDLLADLIRPGLVDECMLLVKPRVLGQGTALFGKVETRILLRLQTSRVFESGCILQHYALSATPG